MNNKGKEEKKKTNYSLTAEFLNRTIEFSLQIKHQCYMNKTTRKIES